jgi:hypothetical protein
MTTISRCQHTVAIIPQEIKEIIENYNRENCPLRSRQQF